jgi:hypothetical protein
MKTRSLPPKKLLAPLCCVLFLIVSCSLFDTGQGEDDEPGFYGSGAALVAHRGYLYLLGGKTDSDSYLDTVRIAKVEEDGSLSSWKEGTALPSARAFHSVIAWADYLYLIGGRDNDGYFDDVWYIYVGSDGYPGARWTKSDFSLPAGLAAAAAFVLDGRMYLAGGANSEGASSELLSARIWRDGEPGLWMPMAKCLPSPRAGATVLRMGKTLYLAGGVTSSTYCSDFLTCALSDEEKMEGWSYGPAMPDARAFSTLVPYGDYPAVLGGEGKAGAYGSAYRLNANSAWAQANNLDGQSSGSAATVRGHAYFLRTESIDGIGTVVVPSKSASQPTARPSSGYVPKNTRVALLAAEEETIRYTMTTDGTEPTDPDESSAVYNAANQPKITTSTILKARSFSEGLDPSAVCRLSYMLNSAGLVYTIEKSFNPSDSYIPCILQETYAGGSTNPLSSVWYALKVPNRGYYTIDIRDGSDDVQLYSDTLCFSLYEGDVLSILRDFNDFDIYKRDESVGVFLDAGTYYLNFSSMTATPGGNFDFYFGSAGVFLDNFATNPILNRY